MSSKIPLIQLVVTEPLSDGTEDVITEIPIDVRVSSNYSFSNEITEFPVESGAAITDHVITRPDQISIEGMVSDSGLVEFPNLLSLRGDNESQRPGTRRQSAFDVIHKIWRERIPLTVVTEYLIYDDMVIESFDVPKTPDQGDALWFSLTLRKINTVETLTASLPPEVVARLKRRRAKAEARRKARRRVAANAAKTSTESRRGKVSPTTASASSASVARAIQAGRGD